MKPATLLVLILALTACKGADNAKRAPSGNASASKGAAKLKADPPAPAAANAVVHDLEWRVNKVCATEPQLFITHVKSTKDETVLAFRFSSQKNTSEIKLFPPKHKLAFTNRSLDGKKKFHLTKVKGIAIAPKDTKVTPGKSLDFEATFEPIGSLRTFNLIEGHRSSTTDLNLWTFLKVRLDDKDLVRKKK